jgi:peptidoglycan/xylan/chitin deacetylase (PgdA/CDA1 family)
MDAAAGLRTAAAAVGVIGVLAAMTSAATPAWAQTPEEKFISDIERSNAVATEIPGTPDRWVQAGYGSCDRISSTVGQG